MEFFPALGASLILLRIRVGVRADATPSLLQMMARETGRIIGIEVLALFRPALTG